MTQPDPIKKVREIDLYSYRAGERQARADTADEIRRLKERIAKLTPPEWTQETFDG